MSDVPFSRRAALISVKAAILRKAIERWPAGAAESRGGQFAPSGSGGGGGQKIIGPQFGGKKPGASYSPMSSFISGMFGSAPYSQKATPKGAKPHPKTNDAGKKVIIDYPSKASDPASTWRDKTKVATFVPGGDTPKSMFGVPFKSWDAPKTIGEWAKVPGQNPSIDDGVPINVPPGLKVGAGVMIVEPDGRVWLTRPSNSFGGYQHTFPKGTVEGGLSLQASAIKEAYEETGLQVKITGVLGDYTRSTSVARYYVAERVGGTPKDMGWESQAVRLSPQPKLKNLLNQKRDRDIADDLLETINIHKSVTVSPLYVRRDVLNAGDVIRWAKEHGFKTTVPADDMHVTVAYSREPLNWTAAGESVDRIRCSVGERSVAPLGDKGAIVLKFDCPALSLRWQEFIDAGASWDYPSYQPHITLTYSNPDGLVPESIPPYRGPIVLGPEVFEPLDLDWSDDIVEKATGAWKEQPRWPAGTPLGGQWLAFTAAGVVMPPKIAGGHEGANSAYQKKADALFAMAEKGDKIAVSLAAGALKDKTAQAALKPKQNSHDKWNAQLSQYAAKLATDMSIAPKAEAIAFKVSGTTMLSDMTHIGAKPGGSSAGGLYKDKDGATWIVKSYAAKGMAENEVLASKLMQAAGIPAPDMKLVDLGGKYNGGVGVASRMLTGAEPFSNGNALQQEMAQQQFAVHAWLANWDVTGSAGFDNLKLTKDGGMFKVVNIDPGGALLFRAMGKEKGKDFGDKVGEWDTLRDGGKNPASASVFGSMSASQLHDSAMAVASVSDDTIKSLVSAYGPTGASLSKDQLAARLIARKNDIMQRAGLADVKMSSGVSVNAPAPAAAPKPASSPALAAKAPNTGDIKFPGGTTVPTFNTGFPIPDKYYQQLAGKMVAAYAAGDFKALQLLQVKLDKNGEPTAKPAWLSKTQNGKKMTGFFNTLYSDLAEKQAAVARAPKQADPVVAASLEPKAPPVAAGQHSGNNPAAPKFDASMLPSSNTNASSHNAKVAIIKALYEKGDSKAILGLGFGSNTYAKKQAQLANDALSALGVSHKVAAGQKPYTHAALQSGAPAVVAAAALKPAPAPAPASPKVTLKKEPVRIPDMPDFSNWNGAGKGLSTSAHVNKQNDQLANQIYSLGLQGKLAELKAMKFTPIDKTTGAAAASDKSIMEHPSKNIVAYWKDVTDAFTPKAPMPKIEAAAFTKAGEAMIALAKSFPDSAKLIDAAHKIGRYGVLGKVSGDPFANWKPKEISTTAKTFDREKFAQQSHAAFNALTSTERTAIKQYTGSSYTSMNDAATGQGTHSMTGYAIKGVEKAAIPIPAGTVFSRTFPLHGSDLQKLLKSKGSVIKDFGIISTGMAPGWSGNVRLRLTAGEGVKGLYVGMSKGAPTISASGHESGGETLLPYGTKFYVRGVYPPGAEIKDAHGNWKINGAEHVIDVVVLPNS